MGDRVTRRSKVKNKKLTQAAVKEHWEVIGLQFALDHQRARHFGRPHETKRRGIAARLHSIARTAIGEKHVKKHNNT
jgi:hypothetical protein